MINVQSFRTKNAINTNPLPPPITLLPYLAEEPREPIGEACEYAVSQIAHHKSCTMEIPYLGLNLSPTQIGNSFSLTAYLLSGSFQLIN